MDFQTNSEIALLFVIHRVRELLLLASKIHGFVMMLLAPDGATFSSSPSYIIQYNSNSKLATDFEVSRMVAQIDTL